MLINKCPRCNSPVQASITIALDIATLNLEINTEEISEVENVGEHHLSIAGQEGVARLDLSVTDGIPFREILYSAQSGDFRIYCENGHTLALFQDADLGVAPDQQDEQDSAEYEN